MKPAPRKSFSKKLYQQIQYIFPVKCNLPYEIPSFLSRKFIFAPRTRKTRGAGYTAVREGGSAHDFARVTAPYWRDGIGRLLHLCHRAEHGQMLDGWMTLMQVFDCNGTHHLPSIFSYSYLRSLHIFSYDITAARSSCTRYYIVLQ